MISIVYLGIFGSLIGFVCYFYILQKLTTANVSLITMMTPVFAILLGNGLNNEVITIHVLLGASAIIVGLALYQQQNIRTKKQQRMVSTAAEKLAEHPELR
ncbi:DMT family transporter [Paraglaciecola aquimarina]|uniref:DMT family transporter n=1 Tax=Paraglaciecola aquimarina TaxID=1235557 RepID=A0ABU3SXV6_9ALTE|nr:DMT family transporter [Paraglaciecola aquimarina]MDU0354828.1 DMT family transporter [Paraglaciecola aquimarina]